MVEIRLANHDDFQNVQGFYYALIEEMSHLEYTPRWEKDVYPTSEFLSDSIENKELYIGEIDGQIASVMVVNHSYNEGYKEIKWQVKAEDTELFVIHALGVRYELAGKGIAKEMVRKVIETARAMNLKAIRLDVLAENTPAERVYLKMGFRYLETIHMFYADTGWTEFKLYEYVV